MALDPYTLCPCGSGKKLKFCCSDLMGEMEKIQRMLEGEQRVACLDYIKSLRTKHPDRASLLSLQAMLETQLEQYDQAQQTIDRLLELQPENPLGLSELALVKVQTEGGRAAIAPLQKAFDHLGSEVPGRTYEALGAVGQALMIEGEFFAARAHLSLQSSIARGKDSRPTTLLMRVLSSPQIPLLLKDDWQPVPAPDDVPWRDEFNQALEASASGCWQRAADRFATLIEPSQNAPQVWFNLALTRSWVADISGAIEALHKYATLDVPNDDAVEAEALAQLLDPAAHNDTNDIVQSIYTLHDYDQTLHALDSDPRFVRVPVETYLGQTDNEGPPPRSALAVLDRPEIRSAADVELSPEIIPVVIGYVYLFGRETDREPRAELITQGPDELAQARETFTQVAGEAAAPLSQENSLGKVSRLASVLSWNWRLPEDTPRDVHQTLLRQRRQEVIFNVWPQTPHPALDGKTLVEAAADPALHIQAQAAVLLLELGMQADPTELDFNRLREQLQLPTVGPVDPDTLADRQYIPIARLARVQADKLTDEELVQQYHRATWFNFNTAQWHLGQEVLRRENLGDKIDIAEVLGQMAELAPTPEQAGHYLEQARQIADQRGESNVPWDLAELALQIDDGNVEAARRLFEHIRTVHGREPGVGQQLATILMDAGLLRPDGSPAAMPAQAEAQPGLIIPGATEEPGKLWTPEQAGDGEKKLWIPD